MANEQDDRDMLIKSLEQQPVDKPKATLFSKAKQQSDPMAVQMASDMNELARRLRLLEERYMNFRRKSQVTEQDMVSTHRNLNKELKSAMSELSELRKSLVELESSMKMVLTELQNCAKKEDIMVLQKYINLWEPVHFVTEQGAKKIAEEVIKRKV